MAPAGRGWRSVASVMERVYEPRGTMVQVFKRREKEVVVSGAAGTGKTRACLEKVLMMCLLNPGMKALILRKTAISLTSTTLDTWEKQVADVALARGDIVWYGGSAREPAAYKFKNGSRVIVGGLDKPEKIMSSEYDIIFVDECTELTVTDWEMSTTRLRNGRVSFQQMLGSCNPNAPTHFLKVRADEGRLVMLNSRHEDNPRYFDGAGNLTPVGREYMETLDALTGVRKLRLRDGLWAGAEGLVYDEFDPGIHLIDSFPIPKDWRRVWGVDFGHTNPFVLQCWAIDHDGRMYLYREIYMSRRGVDQHAQDILDIVAPNGKWIEPRPNYIVTDHDAGERDILERMLGMGTIAAKKDVKLGVETTQPRFRLAGDGKPRIYFMKDALVQPDKLMLEKKRPISTVTEIPGYIWSEEKDVPVKLNDHGCDTMRYVVMEEDTGGTTRVRFA